MADRENLTTRTIPFMELSDGSAASLTAPPAPLPHYLNAEGRAIARFAIEGNVVSKCGPIPCSYGPVLGYVQCDQLVNLPSSRNI
jgi:hypothetical protein